MPHYVVIVHLRLGFLLHRTVQSIAQELEKTSGQVTVLCKFDLVTLHTDTFLYNVHALMLKTLIVSNDIAPWPSNETI